MGNQQMQEDNINIDDLIKKYNIEKKEFTFPSFFIDSYNQDNVILNNNFDLICPICINIINDPKSCSSKKNSHSFCKKCIDIYLLKNDKCPICKNKFEYKDNPQLLKLLNQLSFKCVYKNEGCNKILKYSEYINHINQCNYNNILYQCQVEKLNNSNKKFEKCKYKGYKNEIKKHLKFCAFYNFKCLYCEKNILNINLKYHIEKKCKIGIYNYQNKEKYIGEKKINIREGYGIYNFVNGNKYEGEWKNERIWNIHFFKW